MGVGIERTNDAAPIRTKPHRTVVGANEQPQQGVLWLRTGATSRCCRGELVRPEEHRPASNRCLFLPHEGYLMSQAQDAAEPARQLNPAWALPL